MNTIKHVFLCAVLVCSNLWAVDQEHADKQTDVVADGQKAFDQACEYLKTQDLPAGDRAKINQAVKDVKQSRDTTFNEEELIAAMDMVFDSFDNKLPQQMRDALDDAMQALARRLARFKITGCAFAVDPNGAFFLDTQDPAFNVAFKNPAGEIKTQRFQADIESVGLKIQFSLNLNFIFFVGTDLNYLNAHDKIELGKGFELSPAGLPTYLISRSLLSDETRQRYSSVFWTLSLVNVVLTYAAFKKLKGGLLMVSLCFGIPGTVLSVVTGGSLTPVE